MKGAVIGDIIGSRYEFQNTFDYDFELFSPESDYTDDTICTVAVADAVLRDRGYAEASAAVTHNHPEGIKGAVAIAVAILRMRQAAVKDPYIFEEVANEFYCDEDSVSEPFDNLPERGYFDVTCQGCVPLSLYLAAEATSFEDAIRRAVSYGGDSDTVGAIVGSLAEARFPIPPEMLSAAMSYLPAEMLRVVEAFDARLGR